MKQFILFLKGFIIGIGKIIPGVSGSVLAVSMGIYDQAISKIANFSKNIKENCLYLGPLLIGIGLSIICFSHVILYLVTNYPIVTLTFFLGLFFGSIIQIYQKEVQFQKKDKLLIIFNVFLLFLLTQKINLPSFTITSLSSYLWIIILGGIDALSMIIPGLSGTALFLMLGSYTFILELFANPLANILASLMFSLGFFLVFILTTKGLNWAFNNHSHFTWVLIFSLILYSFFKLMLMIPFNGQITSLIQMFISFFLGIIIFNLTPSE